MMTIFKHSYKCCIAEKVPDSGHSWILSYVASGADAKYFCQNSGQFFVGKLIYHNYKTTCTTSCQDIRLISPCTGFIGFLASLQEEKRSLTKSTTKAFETVTKRRDADKTLRFMFMVYYDHTSSNYASLRQNFDNI